MEALDPSDESVRSQVLASAGISNFDDVVARIEQEQSRRALMNLRRLENQENKAFQVKYSNLSFMNRAKGKGSSSTKLYDHCKKVRHNRDGYWFLHPHLRPVREGRHRR